MEHEQVFHATDCIHRNEYSGGTMITLFQICSAGLPRPISGIESHLYN